MTLPAVTADVEATLATVRCVRPQHGGADMAKRVHLRCGAAASRWTPIRPRQCAGGGRNGAEVMGCGADTATGEVPCSARP